MLNRRQFLHSTAAAPALSSSAGAPPNIILVMTDQHRAGLTRASGFPLDTMPTLDRMAAGGAAFHRAYTTSPLCVPARTSLLTGRGPHAHRVRQNSAPKAAVFDKDLFQTCRSLGYRTALCGKNHSYLTPASVDFWRAYGHLDGFIPPGASPQSKDFTAWMQHENFRTGATPTPFPAELQFPHRIVSDSIEFISQSPSQPFALWVSFPEPHNPYQVPKPYFDLFPPDQVPPRAVGPEALANKGFKWQWLRQLELSTYPDYDAHWRRTRSNYLGLLRLIDDQLARLLQHLDSTGLRDNTILVFMSDHGDYFCEYGLERKGAELPELLTRIPMAWTGPSIRPLRNTSDFVSIADIFPTLCEAIGAPIPAGAQGRSLWPMLTGQPYPAAEFESIYSEVGFGGMHYTSSDPIPATWGRTGKPGVIPGYDELNPVTQSGNLKMVRLGDWKLTFDMLGNAQLYHLASDPYELKNLYNQPQAAEIQPRLLATLLQWTIRTQDDLPTAAYQSKRPAHNWYAPHRNPPPGTA
ncbi:MAG: sulfatase-like hydrolase/transferase [Acidobacteria bacterium]|nr:sulfatase-like hydrolase/transferase [Acidobacteriota bacterium]